MNQKEEFERKLEEDLTKRERLLFRTLNRSIRMAYFISPVNQEIHWQQVQLELRQNKELAQNILGALDEAEIELVDAHVTDLPEVQ